MIFGIILNALSDCWLGCRCSWPVTQLCWYTCIACNIHQWLAVFVATFTQLWIATFLESFVVQALRSISTYHPLLDPNLPPVDPS